MDEEEEKSWANGWVFYKSGDNLGQYLPTVENCAEWIRGFAAALADYDLMQENASIQAALLNQGISGDLLDACLNAADTVVAVMAFVPGDNWRRWPSVPVRDSRHG